MSFKPGKCSLRYNSHTVRVRIRHPRSPGARVTSLRPLPDLDPQCLSSPWSRSTYPSPFFSSTLQGNFPTRTTCLEATLRFHTRALLLMRCGPSQKSLSFGRRSDDTRRCSSSSLYHCWPPAPSKNRSCSSSPPLTVSAWPEGSSTRSAGSGPDPGSCEGGPREGQGGGPHRSLGESRKVGRKGEEGRAGGGRGKNWRGGADHRHAAVYRPSSPESRHRSWWDRVGSGSQAVCRPRVGTNYLLLGYFTLTEFK